MEKLFYFILILFIFSCKKDNIEKPKNIIPKEKMVDLLFDMHLANKSRNIKTSFNEKNPNYFPLIYKKYKIDSNQFKTSHAYYIKNIDLYIEIYKKLEDSIDKLTKQQQKIVKKADSISLLKIHK